MQGDVWEVERPRFFVIFESDELHVVLEGLLDGYNFKGSLSLFHWGDHPTTPNSHAQRIRPQQGRVQCGRARQCRARQGRP